MLRLITIPISHYCEKARWALDLAALPYREERHIQLVHRFAARRAGGGSTVPVLVTAEGVLGESSAIIEWADARLPPEGRLLPSGAEERDEVQRLCRRLDDTLGPAARRLIYVRMLAQRSLVIDYNDRGVPAREDLMLRAGLPLMTVVLRRALGITPGVEVEDEALSFAELDRVAGLLSDGRPYLCGERFTAADLTFAALCAPLTLPERYGSPLPRPEQTDLPTRELVRRAREHPAGAFALRMFAEHRPARVGEGK